MKGLGKKMLKCYHCGQEAVGWIGDYTYEECGMSGEGMIQMYSCENCGADIEFRIDAVQEEPITVGEEQKGRFDSR